MTLQDKIIREFRKKLKKIEEDYTCIEYNAVCRSGLVLKINAIENIALKALSQQKQEIRKAVEGMKKEIKEIKGLHQVGDYIVGEHTEQKKGYNQALTDILLEQFLDK